VCRCAGRRGQVSPREVSRVRTSLISQFLKKRVSLTFTGPALVKSPSVRDLVSKKAASHLGLTFQELIQFDAVDKVRSILESWGRNLVQALYFDGRLELVKSVLYSL